MGSGRRRVSRACARFAVAAIGQDHGCFMCSRPNPDRNCGIAVRGATECPSEAITWQDFEAMTIDDDSICHNRPITPYLSYIYSLLLFTTDRILHALRYTSTVYSSRPIVMNQYETDYKYVGQVLRAPTSINMTSTWDCKTRIANGRDTLARQARQWDRTAGRQVRARFSR